MAILKCKMCGGNLDISEGSTVAVCQYCGTTQTIPSADDDKKLNLFNRANRLRMNSEFDMAAAVYENIVAEFPEEAEAYWGLCLCNYGIEYVDDPATGEKKPTCHRASFLSLEKDENFSLAIEYADIYARKVYRDEAREIDRIMDKILSVSKNEEPYDVFICYKETNSETGERTPDSVLAYDIYDALTAKGFKVFFSRITLEDKLGREYEPYIFAALNSARIMLAVGTRYEYFHAVWVRNEWSRFLKLMAKDKTKLLIPCYKDMDAYDLPDEFRKLQAQDLGKLGAVQDIVRGIEKIVGKAPAESKKEAPSSAPSRGINLDAIIRRAFIALEDGNFDDARANFDKALDIDGECAEAYFGLAMSEAGVSVKKDFFTEESNLRNKKYLRAKQFADSKFLSELTALEDEVRFEVQRKIDEELNSVPVRLAVYRKKIAPFKRMIRAGRTVSSPTICIKSDGNALTTSANGTKAFSCPDTLQIEDAIGLTMLSLKKNGTIVADKLCTPSIYRVTKWQDITEFSAGFKHIVGLKKDGTAVAELMEDTKDYGQCNVSDWKNIISVKTGLHHTVGLINNGTVLCVGKNKEKQCEVYGWTDIVAVSAGSMHTVGLKSDGTVVATGFNRHNQCEVSSWTDIVAVSAGGYHTVGLKNDGTVVATSFTGENADYSGQCAVSSWTDIIAISAGADYTIGLKKDGTLVAAKWAISDYNSGQCNVDRWKLFDSYEDLAVKEKPVSTLSSLAAKRKEIEPFRRLIQAERSISLPNTACIKSDGTVLTTGTIGAKTYYYPDTLQIESNRSFALKNDGTIIADNKNSDSVRRVCNWKNITEFSKGSIHIVGLKNDGTVVSEIIVASGVSQNHGEHKVCDWKDIASVSAGRMHTVGLRKNGAVVAVGNNAHNECNVSAWTDIVAISAGSFHTVGLKSDGTVVATGYNEQNQCTVFDWTDIVAVSAGAFHTVGLKSDGTVVATNFPRNNSEYRGRCEVSEWNDIIAISAGSDYTLGLKKDGTVVATKFLGPKIFYNGQCDINGWKLFDSFENFKNERKEKAISKEKMSEIYRKEKRCQHCGGHFAGIFKLICLSCKKPKDY